MDHTAKPCVIIVDGYKFSHDYVQALAAHDVLCLHISSTVEPLGMYQKTSTFNPKDYHAHTAFTGDFASLLRWARNFTVIAVIPGVENGVTLADQLAMQLGCPHNGITTAKARRDKYTMLEAVQAAGVAAPAFIKTNHAADIYAFAKEKKLQRLVIKPLNEAGGLGVCVVNADDAHHIQQAMDVIQHNTVNFFSNENQTHVLVCEFLEGEEYVVDTVSCAGKHAITDVWCYRKSVTQKGDILYEATQLVSPDHIHYKTLTSYAKQLLDALEVRYGLAHTEIMLTPLGPKIIEVNSRATGFADKKLWEQCFGYNLFDLCVASYLDPDFNLNEATQLKAHAYILNLYNDKAGVVESLPDETVIKSRPSYYKHFFNYAKGDSIQPTCSLFNVPGRIFMVHSDITILKKDYAFYQNYNRENLKVIAASVGRTKGQ